MKVIDKSEFRDENGEITLQNRIRGTLRYGLPWYGILEAQLVVSERLGKSLPNEYTLLRNVLIPGTGLIASMILIGPQGVRTLTASPIGGVYRAKADEWLVQASGGFRKSHPNLQQLALNTSEIVLKYLRDQGYALPEVEAVLIFSNPRAHVDAAAPRARIVLADAIEHFAANLRQAQAIMDAEDVKVVVEAILHPRIAEPEPAPASVRRPVAPPAPRLRPTAPPVASPAAQHAPEVAPIAGPSPFHLEARAAPLARRRAEEISRTRRWLGLTRRQWILLGILLLGEVTVVAIFALVIYINILGG
jgi:hypothetical protein